MDGHRTYHSKLPLFFNDLAALAILPRFLQQLDIISTIQFIFHHIKVKLIPKIILERYISYIKYQVNIFRTKSNPTIFRILYFFAKAYLIVCYVKRDL